MPWLLVPVLPLLLYSSPAFAGMSLSLPYLLIPVAAWLGRHYGAAGFLTVLLGAMLALGPTLVMPAGSFGGACAIYVISLWICRAAFSENPIQGLIGDGRLWRQAWIFGIVLLVLPFSFDFGRQDVLDDLVADIYVTLLPLCLFFLFLFGLAGFRVAWAVAGLAIATLLGILFDINAWDAGLSRQLTDGVMEMRYRFDDLATLATGLSYFLAGRRLTTIDDTYNPWRYPYLMIGGLVLLVFLSQIVGWVLPGLPPAASYFGVSGQYLALPLAAVMAGYLLGYAGIGYCLCVTVALILGINAVSLLVMQQGLWIEVEQPLFCLAFGLLGLRLRDQQTGILRAWPGRRWWFYGLLVLALLPALFSPAELFDLAWPFVAAVGAALLAAGIDWLRRRLNLTGVTLTGEGWLKLAVAIAVLVAIIVNARYLLEGLLAEAASFDLPIEIALPVALVLLHLPLAYLAYVLAQVWPKVAGDLHSIAGLWRAPKA